MKGKALLALGFLTTVFLPIFPVRVAADTLNTIPKVIISEVKLGGDSYSHGTDQPKDPQEFITLYNQSENDIDLTNWVLEYAKPSFDKNYCSDPAWIAHNVSGSSSQTELSGTLKAKQASTPIARPLTDNQGGSLHLVDISDKNNPVVQDLVGWDTNAPCYETATINTPSNGKSIKRYLDCEGLPIDSGDNSKDFAPNQPPSPGALSYPYLLSCQLDNSSTTSQDTQQSTTCNGIVISEVLPNPAGTDTDNEFIELYNPTGISVPLQGCSLQTTGSNKVFNFTNDLLQPGEYRALYGNETGLTLPNAAGGTVWLLSPSTELQAITYENDMDDDVSWALIDGSWQATFQATPNAANILQATKPCAEGEERNSDTGYCRSIVTLTTSSLSACPEGQERNATTNRCRAITTAATKLTPCKEGQVRNPDTNRCKSTATTASTNLKPCPAGQERNPTTNRCRKITSDVATSLASVKDTATNSLANDPHWWLAGIAAVSATSYGVYEWRQEVLKTLSKIKNKLPKL